MKKLILVILLILFSSCRSRSVQKEQISVAETKTETVQQAEEVVKEVRQEVKTEVKKDTAVKQTEKETEKEITGTVEPETPFSYIETTPTGTRTTTITGKANFSIKEKTREQQKEEDLKEASSSLSALVDVAKKNSEETNVSDFTADLSAKASDVKSRGFSAPVYVIVGFCAVILVLGVVVAVLIRKKKNKLKMFTNE